MTQVCVGILLFFCFVLREKGRVEDERVVHSYYIRVSSNINYSYLKKYAPLQEQTCSVQNTLYSNTRVRARHPLFPSFPKLKSTPRKLRSRTSTSKRLFFLLYVINFSKYLFVF